MSSLFWIVLFALWMLPAFLFIGCYVYERGRRAGKAVAARKAASRRERVVHVPMRMKEPAGARDMQSSTLCMN